ncbi:thioredoxin domain-containing protein [Stappia stellulata]|uniref:thioredoxin domain-containing protein n=1 Tax=Stappia stellulata TaxID=71235 RepID=UPI000428BDE5|nr:thioredoxin domain-containing protein [Stappia stellulata]
MTDNRLANATSPYLLQHKDNPVAWRPWGPDALAEARDCGKPILLSVGYAACHWCHVMAHESFEDPDVADVMNTLFVNIKVDREERPDIDQIYMSALHALGEQGGWPLTMFLTSEAEPFWGGTYFPKTARWGRPGFVDVLEAVSKAFQSDRSRIDQNRDGLMSHLRQAATRRGPDDAGPGLPAGLATTAGLRLSELLDPINGGTRGAPKFPQASVMELIWRAGLRAGREDIRMAGIHSLERMSNGGIYDHIGGGLSRYSVDERWLVPHFEKMLYDNAQYLSHLALVAGSEPAPDHAALFRQRIDETVAWIDREMRTDGAFAASLDADTDGEEGKSYVWTPDAVVEVLGKADAAAFNRVYDISPAGNFEGASIPNRLTRTDDPNDPTTEARLAETRKRLLTARDRRPQPGRDDKILTDWNGLLVSGLARAAEIVSRESLRDMAVETYRVLMKRMMTETGLAHAWRAGTMVAPGFATDHAAMMLAALALAETSPDPRETEGYIQDAEQLGTFLDRHYRHESGGYYLTSDRAEDLIVRPLSPMDEATPNANAMAAEAFVRLWHLTGDNAHRARADAIVAAFAEAIPKNVFGTAGLLNALDTLEHGVLAVMVTRDGARDRGLDHAILALGDPSIIRRTVEESGAALPDQHPAAMKPTIDGMPTLYLCTEGRCGPPLTDPSRVAEALHALRGR